MDNKQDLQKLQEALLHHCEQAKSLQNSIKRVLITKKESELQQQEQALLNQIETFTVDMSHLEEKMAAVKNEQRPGTADAKKESKKGDKNQSDQERRPADPADQEHAYQLKALMMPQIHSQNKTLQAELTLYNRRNELRGQRKERQVSYNRETNLSAATTLHIINMYEKRAKEAERRADALQAELDGGDGKDGQRDTTNKPKQSSDKTQSHLPAHKVDDIVKKNQLLTSESQDQQREIQRLKRENAELVLKVKHSSQDRNQIMSQLSTSEMARKDLQTRFQKQKAQHDRLSKSLTRQSTDWIEARKQRDQEEESLRWRQVGHAAPHGAQTRTFSHRVPRNVDQPRNMFPATAYAQPQLA